MKKQTWQNVEKDDRIMKRIEMVLGVILMKAYTKCDGHEWYYTVYGTLVSPMVLTLYQEADSYEEFDQYNDMRVLIPAITERFHNTVLVNQLDLTKV